MSQFKSKVFKKIFEANADDIVTLNGEMEHVITQDTFVPLMGQMWEKAKDKYKKRYLNKTFQFAEWVSENYMYHSLDKLWYYIENNDNVVGKTTEELFEIWKKEQ